MHIKGSCTLQNHDKPTNTKQNFIPYLGIGITASTLCAGWGASSTGAIVLFIGAGIGSIGGFLSCSFYRSTSEMLSGRRISSTRLPFYERSEGFRDPLDLEGWKDASLAGEP